MEELEFKEGTLSPLEEARELIDRVFPIEGSWFEHGAPVFGVRISENLKEDFLSLKDKLEELGYLPLLRRRREGNIVLILMPKPLHKESRWTTNLLLLLATLLTTYLAGYLNSLSLVQSGFLKDARIGGLAFSLSLIAIIGAHEMGHKFMSIFRGIDSSLPYFIPAPPPFLLGTFGAIIHTKTPAPNRDALFDLGAAGPIVGFLATVPILAFGIANSFIVYKAPLGTVSLGEPILLKILARYILNPPQEAIILIHPMGFAGWIGMLVTTLNLMPAGMMDGGHASRAIFGPRYHNILSYVAIALTALLGYWLMALILVMLLRRGHPGPLDDVSTLSIGRKITSLLLLLIFILCVTPAPISLPTPR